MITLDGVELNINMVMPERFSSKTVAMAVKRTLGGKPVVRTGKVPSGYKITLNAGETFGWLSKLQVEAVLTRAEVAGAIYTLVYGPDSYQVMFDSEDGPAVELLPFVPRNNHEDTDQFFGVIRLLVL